MDKKFYFLIAIHFHQPVGNFDYVVEKACDNCYEPFLDKIKDFPEIKFNLHYSGCLLEWFEKHRPILISKIKKLVQKNQVELMGGGFYEPVLAVLSRNDRLQQIEMLSQYLKDKFAGPPKGAWLAERVWEPQLAWDFSNAGIRYTIVDDTHLRYSGLAQEELYGYYTTEDSGGVVSIFPSDKFLRYAIPFKPPQDAIDYFLKVRDVYKKNCVLYGDDGEKFGEWPGTKEWVYNKKWIDNFLNTLCDNASWVKTLRISDYMQKHPPAGRIYMPTASYQEMSEWALPADSAIRFEDISAELKRENKFDRCADFIRGGFWRNFFVKYPESNQMHKRMMLVSERLGRLNSKPAKQNAQAIAEAKRDLFRSQCNCAYWHGVFGGLYLYHLRSAIYKNIISSDRALDAIEYKTASWVSMDKKDFDCDGTEEVVVSTSALSFTIDAAEGATVTELDIKQRCVNLVNTLSRRKEAYHRKLKELILQKASAREPQTIHGAHFSNSGLASKELIYDNARRVMFIDRFISAEPALADIINNRIEYAGDFADIGYEIIKLEKRARPYVEFAATGDVNGQKTKVSKKFIFSPQSNVMTISYCITNDSQQNLEAFFAPEINLALTQDDKDEAYSEKDLLLLKDEIEGIGVRLKFSQIADKIFKYCVRTVSQSERDIEENYSATCVLPLFRVSLQKAKNKAIDIEMEVSLK